MRSLPIERPRPLAKNVSSVARLELARQDGARRRDKQQFGLWQDALSRRPILASGFGRDVRERAIAEAVRSGRLERPRNSKLARRPGQRFARAIDRLNLPADLTIDNSRMVFRAWFDRSASRDEMAALLFMRAAGRIYRRELQARFDWSEPTALAVLRTLRSRGIVECSPASSATYTVCEDIGMQLPAAAPPPKNPGHGAPKNPGTTSVLSPKNPGHGDPGHGKPGHIRRDSSDGTDSSGRNRESYDTRGRFATGDPRFARHDDDAFGKVIQPLPPERIILANWKSAPFFREKYELRFMGQVETVVSLEDWCWWLDYFGGAPARLKAPPAYRQALEIAHELHAVGGVYPWFAMVGIAYAVSCAHSRGQEIRSLALVAEPLLRKAMVDDDTWAYDVPARRSESFDRAHRFATQVADTLEIFEYGIKIHRRALLSVHELEQLSRLIHMHTWDGMMHAVNHVTRNKLRQSEGRIIASWSWFEKHVDAARAAIAAAQPQPAPQQTPRRPPQSDPYRPSQADVDAACEWLRSYLGDGWHNSHRVSNAARRAGIGHQAYQAASEVLNRQKARNPSNGAWMTALPGVPPLPGVWPGSPSRQLRKKHREEELRRRQERKAQAV